MTSTLTVGSWCSGIGGLELGIERALGARTLWHAEIDPHASTVLARHWPGVPNHGDLRATDWATVEPVDVVCFGFPCQDISSAGRRAGLKGERSGLWFDCVDALRLVRPRYVLVENVAALLVRGIDRVVADLAEMGYVGRWGCLRSSDTGAPHRRERIFLAAADARRPRAGRDTGAVPRPAAGPRRPGANVRPAVNGRAATPDPATPGRGPRNAGAGAGQAADGAGQALHRGRRGPVAHPHSSGQRTHLPHDAQGQPDAAWGVYAAAVARWELHHGAAPVPRDDRGRLNPALPEWMLGYPPGWVTDPAPGLPRTAQLRVLGNSVQPQVAELAARLLLAPLLEQDVAA